MLCPSCDTPNRDNAKFCKKCGKSFTPDITEAAGSAEQSEGKGAVGTTTAVEQSEAPLAYEATPAPANSYQLEEDISLAPTQILTPEQVAAYHARRWPHVESEPRPTVAEESYATVNESTDIASMPTLLMFPAIPSVTPDAAQQQPAKQERPAEDIADMPTILMPLGEPTTEDLVATNSGDQQEETLAVVENEPQTESSTDTSGENRAMTAEAPLEEEKSPTTSEEEDAMEQEQRENITYPEEEQVQPAQEEKSEKAVEGFPVQEVGALIHERYEVTHVLNEGDSENVYEVIDRQGYQRCWNCDSEENAEGDEFCINCGAELLNVTYMLHEYAATESKGGESQVLQGVIANTFVEEGRTYVVEQAQDTQTVFPNGVRLVGACDSDAGAVRRGDPNEDSAVIVQLQRVHESIAIPVGLYIVADGMGGHDAGQVASRMAIGAVVERVVRELIMPPLTTEKAGEEPEPINEDALVTILEGAVQDANTVICQTNQKNKTDMGSTITGFMMVGDHAYIINVGDSRTYMLRDGKLYQLTHDHSLVGQLVAGGLIEPDEIYSHPQRSQIYRSLGDKLNVQVDIFKQQVHPGDRLLSCSDGLWEMIRDPQITEILQAAPDPQTACLQLIEIANTNGGEDNVSAAVVFVS